MSLETKETRKETAQRCAALKERKETNLSKETTRRRTITAPASLPAMNVLKLTAFSRPPPSDEMLSLPTLSVHSSD